MNFIRKIIEGKVDEATHRQFTRYGKGIYENNALIDITKTKNKVRIKTSFEFANEFVEFLANTINGKTRVTGSIITTKDITKELTFEISAISQFAGVKNYKIDCDLGKEEIITSMNNIPDVLFLFSFSTEQGDLKIKAKSSKSGKPSAKGKCEEARADFCMFKTNNMELAFDLTFDVKKEFSKVFIKHTFKIDDIIMPDEYKNDFAKARIYAKRKGKLIRTVIVNGRQEEKTYDLIA